MRHEKHCAECKQKFVGEEKLYCQKCKQKMIGYRCNHINQQDHNTLHRLRQSKEWIIRTIEAINEFS